MIIFLCIGAIAVVCHVTVHPSQSDLIRGQCLATEAPSHRSNAADAGSVQHDVFAAIDQLLHSHSSIILRHAARLMKLKWPSLCTSVGMTAPTAEEKQEQHEALPQPEQTDSDHSSAPQSILSAQKPAMPPQFRKPRLHRLSQDSRVMPALDTTDENLHDDYQDRQSAEAAAYDKARLSMLHGCALL